MRRENKAGGGARTNLNGLFFEQKTSLKDVLDAHPDFEVKGDIVFRKGQKIALLCGKNKLYKNLFKPNNVDPRDIVSKKLLPDEAILVGNTVYIIEKKFQSRSGSVDEKLQTCDFKKKQYTKLLGAIGLQIEYIYIFNAWFNKPEYRDVHEYILSVGCQFYFNEIPLDKLGLPRD